MVTACVQTQEITSAAVDVKMSRAGAEQPIVGYWPSEVRAFQKNGGNKEEVIGANCAVSGDGFVANIMTPALVNVPHAAQNSKAVNVKCVTDNKEGAANAQVYNKTTADSANRATVMAGGGLLGAMIGTAIANNAEKSRDPACDTWAFRPINVDIE